MAKIEFTQILETLNRTELEAAVAENEGQIFDAKYAAAALDDGVNEELNRLELAGRSTSANKQSNCYVARLKKFLSAKNLSSEIETIPVELLCQYLRYFYSELRTQKGSYFSPATLICIRAGIQRYHSGAPRNRPINIVTGSEFVSANKMLKVMGTMYLCEGGAAMQYRAIDEGDLRKLASYFDRSSPQNCRKKSLSIYCTIFANAVCGHA
jgi:hypothetical protein